MRRTRKTTPKSKPRQNKAKDLRQRELTEDGQARLRAYRQRKEQAKPLKFKPNDGANHPGSLTVMDMDDPLIQAKLAEAFGTTDSDVQRHLFDQVVQTFAGVAVANDIDPDGFNNEKLVHAANRTAAILAGIRPQDELEAMLAVQMIAVHNAAIHTTKLAMLTGQTFEGKRSNMNYTTKLMTIFTNQMEALKKYRTGGQQKMVVEHVHVNEGGQAVVGQVDMGGGA